MYEPATHLLNELSNKKTSAYTLNDRIGFLSRALSCARKMNETQNEENELIYSLRERMECAKIQTTIYSKLKILAEQQMDGQQDTKMEQVKL
jgi:hypothetical protein